MVAALEISKRHSTTLLAPKLPSPDELPRVEAVPGALIALMVELGIHPRQIGVERLYQSRLSSWEHEDFVESAGPVTAHVQRPALDVGFAHQGDSVRSHSDQAASRTGCLSRCYRGCTKTGIATD